MNNKQGNEFLTAVDIVCGECICRSEETCENCAVRATVQEIRSADEPAYIGKHRKKDA